MKFEAEWNNTIYFENGIKHELTYQEISIIRKAIISVEVNKQEEVALEELKSLFLDQGIYL